MKPLATQVQSVEERAIKHALVKHDGSIVRAARELRVNRIQFRRLVRRYQLQELVRNHSRSGKPPAQGNAAWRALDDEVCA